MKWTIMTAFAAMWMMYAFINNCNVQKKRSLSVLPQQDKPTAALLQRGKYLVTIMGCSDCHSPKKLTPQGPRPDIERFLSGFDSRIPFADYNKDLVKDGKWVIFNGQNTAFAGPWGVSFAANLTPDETGIGSWSLEQFRKAMRQGKYKGLDNTRPLLPPMPWQNYTGMSDGDLKAVFTYLKSLKAVSNAVPPAKSPI